MTALPAATRALSVVGRALGARKVAAPARTVVSSVDDAFRAGFEQGRVFVTSPGRVPAIRKRVANRAAGRGRRPGDPVGPIRAGGRGQPRLPGQASGVDEVEAAAETASEALGRGSRIGEFLRSPQGKATLAGVIGVDTALFAKDILDDPLADIADEGRGDRLEGSLRDRIKQQVRAQVRARRLSRDAAENVARIAQTNPRLAQSLIAGKKIPKGGTLIGGQAQETALDRLAMMMAMGRLDQGSSPEEQLTLLQ